MSSMQSIRYPLSPIIISNKAFFPLPSGKSRVPCVYRIYQRAQQVMSPGNTHLSSALVAAAEDWLYLTFMAP